MTIKQKATVLAKDDLANNIITKNQFVETVESYVRWLTQGFLPNYGR